MKMFIDALTWAIAATSALAVIGTSISAAKDLTMLKALRARQFARGTRVLYKSEHVPKVSCVQRQERG